MAAYISFQPSDHFNTKIYTGNNTAGQSYTGLGFQPDFVWSKSRTAGNYHGAWDSVRGVEKLMYPTVTNAQTTTTDGLSAFGADGITFGANGTTGDSSNFVNWCWKMGTTSGATFGSADITPSAYSINTTTGQGVYTYSGTGSSAQTVAHGLGIAPDWVIIKRIEDNGHGWQTTNTKLGFTHTLKIESNGAVSTSTPWWNDTAPTSDVVNIGGDSWNNLSGKTFVMYCFTNKRGYSKFGAYEGNGNNDGPFIYTGFRPAFVIAKRTDSTGNWRVIDNKRNSYNGQYNTLETSTSGVQYTGSDDFGNTDLLSNGFKIRDDYDQVNASTYAIDFLSNGFKIGASNGVINGGGNSYIYTAFAEFPFVSSNSIPTVAR